MLVVDSRIRLRWSAIALCALVSSPWPLFVPTGAAAQGLDYRDPSQAPPSWRQFAKLVQYRFETWITADEEVANRFRRYLANSGKEDGPPPTLVVRAWLNPDGTVERVSFAALKDARADADLRTILTRGNVGEAPPPEMLQPLSLRFSLNLKK
ncbi:hypothetical protein GWE18_30255 [Bradyrhizobium sp. CSA112]|uniref:hypothetical protein n=1 Tax=Bradyrhizobium sp. CSA112 TaxID=2699170 RepID=UPI0023AFA78B|nr:hypothetical protein [Bradyrhizobium sp. CSA112]MDE5457035.1 hypothetical protein [Bradyrhizobium sp. CSA112]